jgi:hypothetical protein
MITDVNIGDLNFSDSGLRHYRYLKRIEYIKRVYDKRKKKTIVLLAVTVIVKILIVET